MDERVPVLVVGAGLAGLSTAMFLARRGIRPLVLERHQGTSIHPKANGQNPRTMELLRIGGVADEVLAASYGTINDSLVIKVAESLHGRVFHSIVHSQQDMDFSTASPAPWGMATQDRVEPILLRQAEKLGARVWFDTEVVSVEQDGTGVTARVLDRPTGRLSTVRADYLVAADGGRSPIRRKLDIPTHGRGALSHHIGVIFEADLAELVEPNKITLFYLQNPAFTGVLGASDETGGRHIFTVQYHPERGESAEQFTERRLVELIRIATDAPELEPVIRGVQSWEMAARIADTFRVGRVFLAGDAAKVTPPTGGMGGNAAVQDGYDLAWKLAAVLTGQAGPGLLDSYHAERAPVAELVVNDSLANYVERMAPHLAGPDIPESAGHDRVLLGFRYRSGAILAEDDDPAPTEDPFQPTGRPGFRAPHVPLRDNGTEVSTLDLYGVDWLVFTGPDGDAWHGAADEVAARLGVPLRVVQVGGAAGLDDPTGRFTEVYGIGAAGASLVRPDGMVAWRRADQPVDPTATLLDVLCRVLDRRVP
ncbi:2-polyprenyl-6-methoxyphenol hydroxylase [Goodfellowiella coeruleoviolacea]|uniref:2-polyprenyl-6-methoxyphenol hydroxylase n=1 Tax=Goodfellowiella coeruleoviolacea TaxID=334858 RepID=A0AAE3GIS1_9PSEU|nr:2-polyprenyl-6-methoxyphenol hydroxylase [Goodfellowiella coeruleoviolacea]